MVEQSRLLTKEERVYWKNNLPNMNDIQLQKLERILGEAASVPWTEQINAYIATIAKGQVSLPLTPHAS